jgi:hypothetical protein
MVCSAREIIVLGGQEIRPDCYSAVSPFNVVNRIITDISLDSAILAPLQSEKIDIFLS